MSVKIEFQSSGRQDIKLPVLIRFCRKVKRFWYKKKYKASLIDGLLYGKFYVRYKEGHRGVKMYYKTAKDYAQIFCGEVIDAF